MKYKPKHSTLAKIWRRIGENAVFTFPPSINAALNENIKFKINNDSDDVVGLLVQMTILGTYEDFDQNSFRSNFAVHLAVSIIDVTLTTETVSSQIGVSFNVNVDIAFTDRYYYFS